MAPDLAQIPLVGQARILAYYGADPPTMSLSLEDGSMCFIARMAWESEGGFGIRRWLLCPILPDVLHEMEQGSLTLLDCFLNPADGKILSLMCQKTGLLFSTPVAAWISPDRLDIALLPSSEYRIKISIS